MHRNNLTKSSATMRIIFGLVATKTLHRIATSNNSKAKGLCIFFTTMFYKNKKSLWVYKTFCCINKKHLIFTFFPWTKEFLWVISMHCPQTNLLKQQLGLNKLEILPVFTNLWTSLKKLEIWQVLHTRIMTEIKDLSFYLVMGKGYGWFQKFRKGSKYPDWKLKCFSLKLKFLQDMWVMTNVEKDSTTLKIVT